MKKLRLIVLSAVTLVSFTSQKVDARVNQVSTDREGVSTTALVALSRCKTKELGKSRRDKEVCARSGSSQYWQPILKESDVYSLTSFCSQYLQASVCAWFEKLSFWYLDNGKRPGAVCVRMIREYILSIKSASDTYGSVSGTYITKNIMPPITKKYRACTDPGK